MILTESTLFDITVFLLEDLTDLTMKLFLPFPKINSSTWECPEVIISMAPI